MISQFDNGSLFSYHRYIGTVVIAPLITKGRNYPTRIPITFKNKKGQIVLDQIRTIDKNRLIKKVGAISKNKADVVLDILAEMFAP